jgi:hypothetical protein
VLMGAGIDLEASGMRERGTGYLFGNLRFESRYTSRGVAAKRGKEPEGIFDVCLSSIGGECVGIRVGY